MFEVDSIVDGKYRIMGEVGKGGMSVVYLARNEKANKNWAIKVARKSQMKGNQIAEQNLMTEIKVLTQLDHPSLPRIIDVIEESDCYIIIMDYIEGNSLKDLLTEYGAQPQENVIKWGIQLCDVLGYLHTRTPPIIYRDMKPSNIMLKPDGNITLIDFGTVREYKEEKVMKGDTISMGTPGYAAPEQYGRRGQTDARTDIYALGATLFHLVTGEYPTETSTNIPSIRQINPALREGLDRIIQKCVQANPDDRYQSAAELMYDLQNIVPMETAEVKKKKRKLAVFLTSVFLTAALAGASLWGYVSADRKKSENYDYILANAAQVEDYYSAILTDPARTEAYLGNQDFNGLVQFLIEDGTLDVQESAAFMKLKTGLDEESKAGYLTSTDVLGRLRSAHEAGYEAVCNEIGEAYLFYYDVGVEKDKYAAAASWFQYAQNEYPATTIYCDISECLQNIAKYKKSEEYGKLSEAYQTLWGQMNSLQADAASYEDDLKLRVWREIVSMIGNNTNELCEVISKEEVLNLLHTISRECETVTNTFLQESIVSLQKSIETAEQKAQSVKSGQKTDSNLEGVNGRDSSEEETGGKEK